MTKNRKKEEASEVGDKSRESISWNPSEENFSRSRDWLAVLNVPEWPVRWGLRTGNKHKGSCRHLSQLMGANIYIGEVSFIQHSIKAASIQGAGLLPLPSRSQREMGDLIRALRLFSTNLADHLPLLSWGCLHWGLHHLLQVPVQRVGWESLCLRSILHSLFMTSQDGTHSTVLSQDTLTASPPQPLPLVNLPTLPCGQKGRGFLFVCLPIFYYFTPFSTSITKRGILLYTGGDTHVKYELKKFRKSLMLIINTSPGYACKKSDFPISLFPPTHAHTHSNWLLTLAWRKVVLIDRPLGDITMWQLN